MTKLVAAVYVLFYTMYIDDDNLLSRVKKFDRDTSDKTIKSGSDLIEVAASHGLDLEGVLDENIRQIHYIEPESREYYSPDGLEERGYQQAYIIHNTVKVGVVYVKYN